MIICPQCQSQHPDSMQFCTTCGTQLSTTPLTLIPQSALSDSIPLIPLPEGTLIGNRYLIQQVLEQQPYIITYLAAAAHHDNQIFLVEETREPGRLGAEIEIAGLSLTGAGLRPPLDTFRESSNDQVHTYLVKPLPGTPLAQIPIPQELVKVLQWGVSLATGLSTLHQHDIAYGQITRQTIHMDQSSGDVFLADFSTCLQPGLESLYQAEVRQLALVLYELLTGQTQYDSTHTLPEPVHELVTQIIKQTKPLTAAELREALQQLAVTLRPPLAVQLHIGKQTDVGRARPLNEDSILVLESTWSNRSINQPLCLLVVADGMGGHQGGEIASGLAVQTIGRLAFQNLLPVASGLEEGQIDSGAWLQAAVQAANQTIMQQRLQAETDMGSTLVAAILIHDTAYIAHVGDSRAYHLHQNGIHQLTTDHSLVERLVATNQISREEARHHPQANVVYRTLGDKPQVEIDLQVFPVPPDDYLLLCSDGLSDMLRDEEIHAIVMAAASPQTACTELINAANKAGGADNISIILVRLQLLPSA